MKQITIKRTDDPTREIELRYDQGAEPQYAPYKMWADGIPVVHIELRADGTSKLRVGLPGTRQWEGVVETNVEERLEAAIDWQIVGREYHAHIPQGHAVLTPLAVEPLAQVGGRTLVQTCIQPHIVWPDGTTQAGPVFYGSIGAEEAFYAAQDWVTQQTER